MSMRIYNKNGVSSSLATTVREAHWNKRGEGNNGKLSIVPVITLSSLLRLLPAIYCRMGILGRRADAAWIDDELVENGSKKKVVWITCDSFRWQTEGQRGVWDEVAKVTTSCRSMWRFLSF